MGIWFHWVFTLASIEIDVTSTENVCKEWQSMVSLYAVVIIGCFRRFVVQCTLS
jgi:hypothetical protein